MSTTSNKLYLDDIDLLLYAISLMPSNVQDSTGLSSSGLLDPYIGRADTIRKKLQDQFPNFDSDEVQYLLWALRDYLGDLNKSKAVARKGTAVFKRTHHSLNRVNRMISVFQSYVPPTA